MEQHITHATIQDSDWTRLAEFDARRQLLVRLYDSLLQLRLDTKYLLFDLEATRRERDTYRDQLCLHLAEHHARR